MKTFAPKYIVPWPYLDFWDRLGIAVGAFPAVNRGGLVCALMTYHVARRRLGTLLYAVQAQYGGPVPRT